MGGLFSKGLSKDLLAGLIFVGFGLAFGYASLTYEVGHALRMGPGYFPLVLSVIIVVLGAIILFQAAAAPPIGVSSGGAPWIGLVLIMGGLIFFGFTVRGLGLVPALFVTSFVSAFASKQTGIVGALLIAAFLTAISVIIFVWGLGLPLRLFGPWLNF